MSETKSPYPELPTMAEAIFRATVENNIFTAAREWFLAYGTSPASRQVLFETIEAAAILANANSAKAGT